jgi:hypothetical protein
MKKLIFLLTIICFSQVIGQQKHFKINWEGEKTLSTSSSKIIIPSFNQENFSFSYEDGLKEVSNLKFQTISEFELKGLKSHLIPNKLKYKLQNSNARDKRNAYFEISPIIEEEGVYKKLTSFSISYRNNAGRGATRNSQTITNSVLAQGDWFKFYVDTTGVFKLDRNFLSDLGVNTNNVDPRTIKIYGQGGRMLPMSNSEFYPSDLTENAVKFIGEEDGTLNNDDHILFYAEGPKEYNLESNTNLNAYTDRAYYFVNVSGGNGKRIGSLSQPTGSPSMTITTFHDYKFHEVDEFNLAQLGRRWFGNRFDFDNEKIFDFEFPDIITTTPVRLRVYAAASGEVPSSMQVTANGSQVDNFSFSPINDPILGDDDSFNGSFNIGSGNVSVVLSYNNGGNPSSFGFLDYISVEAERTLRHYGEQFRFKNNSVSSLSGIGEYIIENAASIDEIWDVTDIYNVTAITNSESLSNFSFKAGLGESRLYQVVEPSDYFEPQKDSQSRVENQNLKGTVLQDAQGQFQDIDYLIITREDMLSEAERLAQINRDQNKLNVKVYTLDKIYNEFSSGNPDISGIRNFVKYVYNNASAPENRIKYLCLFGDSSFDYKDRVNNNTNVVPSWHSYSSFSLTNSYVSDDFFGMMDDTEGNMAISDRLDVAVGRILADTPQRAKEQVDKIASYYSSESYGSWRNNIMLISDDVDEPWETILQETSESIANAVDSLKTFINIEKVFTDSYQQEATAGGERYPEAKKAIFDAIEVGALVVNYFGHGGEDGLAGERIFDKLNAQELKNTCKLNCFVTVTCEYTKFDNPLRETAGEFLIWNKDGGAIGLITTTRQIFVSFAVVFNMELEKYLFGFGTNDYPSMAEALRLTKSDPSIAGRGQKRLVFFMGDPAMKLAFPRQNIRLTAVNDVPISSGSEVLEALSQAKIAGEVTDESGNVLTNYNGVLTTTIYDKEIQRSTLGNDGQRENGSLLTMDFNTLGEAIFRGQATIQNGQFEFNFVVPRDIGVPVGNGRISFYAKSDSPLQDQTGSSTNIQIGGLNANALEDNTGPSISLFMNDEQFVSGGITNETPTLLAKLHDENGINTASGIGHDIVAILDGDETNPFTLNDYYVSEVDDYQRGSLSYPFRDLEPGLHTLTLKAWDVYNNSSISEIQFIVHNQNEELVITNVLNYPNPFINYTEFWFNHNSSEVLDVSVQIFTVSGKLVRTINGQTSGGNKITSSVSKDIVWDGRDDFGDKIGKGVYVYKLIVKSAQLNKQVEKIQKLVIL